MSPRLSFLLGLVLVSGCNSVPLSSQAEESTSHSRIVHIWENPGSEFPTMCMILKSDGRLYFVGGFRFFNPSKWRLGNHPGSIVVTLGGTAPFPTESAKSALTLHSRAVASFDESTRELEFTGTMAPDAFLSVGGFNFIRSATCGAA